ncbi:MAG: hypothetical protein JJU36_01575 [Phycisphaeraceae bacterium]|nr:hypothetical protein [Phycisphaeraceae bacterium]
MTEARDQLRQAFSGSDLALICVRQVDGGRFEATRLLPHSGSWTRRTVPDRFTLDGLLVPTVMLDDLGIAGRLPSDVWLLSLDRMLWAQAEDDAAMLINQKVDLRTTISIEGDRIRTWISVKPRADGTDRLADK